MSRKRVQFDLVNNAMDSLVHAVDHLTFVTGENTQSDFKLAILDISRAAELLIKEKLYRVHPAFIWRNVDKYPSLDALTVSADEGIARLERIANVEISENDKNAIKSCKRIRNAIEHHKVDISEEEAKIAIGRMLAFIFDFSSSQLKLDLREEFNKDDRWAGLLYVYEFTQAYGDKLQKKMESEGKIVQMCSNCEGMSFDIISEVCELCGHTEVVDDYA